MFSQITCRYENDVNSSKRLQINNRKIRLYFIILGSALDTSRPFIRPKRWKALSTEQKHFNIQFIGDPVQSGAYFFNQYTAAQASTCALLLLTFHPFPLKNLQPEADVALHINCDSISLRRKLKEKISTTVFFQNGRDSVQNEAFEEIGDDDL